MSRGRLMWPVAGTMLVIGAALAWALWWSPEGDEDEAVEFSHVLHVSWSYTLRNPNAYPIREARFTSFAPGEMELGQELVRFHADSPFELLNQGRTLARIEAGTLPPFGQRTIRMEAEVHLAAERRLPAQPEVEWLAPSALAQSDDPEIHALALQLRRSDAAASVGAIYDWVVGNLVYSGYDPVDRGARHALRSRSGDCTEFAALTVALARAMRIPARLATGYVISESGPLRADDYHAWAELLTADRWIVMDPQRAVPDAPPAHYLVIAYDDVSRSVPGTWHRFHTENEGLVISMR